MRKLPALLLALLLAGCTAGTAPPTPEALPTVTVLPSPTPETTLGDALTMESFEAGGVRLAYDPSIVSSVALETIPASPPVPDGMVPSGIFPEHRQLTLKGYPAENTRHLPQLFVYPVEEFATMNAVAEETIAQLQQLLAEEPAEPQEIPVLPIFNAAQVIRAQVEYLPFENGRGVRFLTQYDQAPYPIHNQGMFYTFQGLTDDGAYYVAAILPVAADFLPDSGDPEQLGPESGFPELSLDNELFGETLTTYFATTTQTLNSATGEEFTPDLLALDGLVMSLDIGPPGE